MVLWSAVVTVYMPLKNNEEKQLEKCRKYPNEIEICPDINPRHFDTVH